MACACGKDSCGCGTAATVLLQDEAGILHPFIIADRLSANRQEYVLLMDQEDAERMALLRVERSADGTETYRNIESDEEWEQLRTTLFQPH
ncbi:MAG: DUF1292 domain-containing protein [Alicyclobacillus sp.]|nr:DUF1292 domain-containing protein [Alicyclobacillus sp.]